MIFGCGFVAAGFDVLDEGLGGALVCLFFEFLLDLVAEGRPGFEADRFADAFDAAGLAFRADVLPDFLRVFLDIRLPFVAFRGSIIAVLKLAATAMAGQVSLAFSDYAQKDFDAPPAALVSAGCRRCLFWGTDHFCECGNRGTICKYRF